MYYGTEQAFAGSNDPKNRESLWPHYDTSHMIYQYIGQIVKFRNQQGPAMYYMKQIERYVDDQFFAFTRSYVSFVCVVVVVVVFFVSKAMNCVVWLAYRYLWPPLTLAVASHSRELSPTIHTLMAQVSAVGIMWQV